MSLREALSRWLDVRPHEVSLLCLAFSGAFAILASVVAGRSVRDALYLTSFDVTTLPYVMASTAVLAVPVVHIFSKLLARYEARGVLRRCLYVQIGGIALLSPWLETSRFAVVTFYLWTALGTLVLTAGYWVVMYDLFPLRSAKRLFGIIGAGGSLGAMVFGLALGRLTALGVHWLAALLIVPLSLLILVLAPLPRARPEPATGPAARESPSGRAGFRALWRSSHLRSLALIVMTATVATTLVDYQFKETLRSEIPGRADLIAALGAFYGWTGGLSLLVQVLLSGRVLARFGVARTLSVLPLLLSTGSLCFFLFPTLPVITAVRGIDSCLRRSLHRPVLEVLFIPVPPGLRESAKGFIDSVLDSAAEGVGAGIVFLWVTWGKLSCVYLSVFVVAGTGAFLLLNFGLRTQYVQTLAARLREWRRAPHAEKEARSKDEVMTRSTESLGISLEALHSFRRPAGDFRDPEDARDTVVRSLRCADDEAVLQTLRRFRDWHAGHVPALVALLAREGIYAEASRVLAQNGPLATGHLVRVLCDGGEDPVIRRRIPRILALIPGAKAERALLECLQAERFEIRCRAGLALWRRLEGGIAFTCRDWRERIWAGIRYDAGRDAQLNLAHASRLLALALESQPVLLAFRALEDESERLRSIALEYLEHILPSDIWKGLCPLIGDSPPAKSAGRREPAGGFVRPQR